MFYANPSGRDQLFAMDLATRVLRPLQSEYGDIVFVVARRDPTCREFETLEQIGILRAGSRYWWLWRQWPAWSRLGARPGSIR